MKEVTKAQLVSAVKDINEFTEVDPQIKLGAKDSAKSIIKKLQKLQDSGDQLLFGDWNPKNPKQSLKQETVDALFAAGIKSLPEGWSAKEEEDKADIDGKPKGKGKKKKADANEEDEAQNKPKDKKKDKKKGKAEDSEADGEKPKKKKKKSGPSNKEIVYTAWIKDKATSPADLYKLVEGNIAEKTVKIWVSAWSKGKNLPSCATK